MTTTEPHPPLTLTNPFSNISSTFTTSSTTTSTTTSSSTSSSTNITKSQSSIGLHTPANSNEEDEDTPTQLHRTSSDGRRNSFGQPLPSPTETWKPTFNRMQSWNREDRKREIVLKREIKEHEGHGGGFSEKR